MLQGDFLVNGENVLLDVVQCVLMLDYCKQVEVFVGVGMDIGVVGVGLGVKVVSEVFKGIFFGDMQGIEECVNVEVVKIEVEVKKLCGLLLGMMVCQQVLVVVVLVFKFYVMMDQFDIDDCGK